MPKGVYKRMKPIWNRGLTKETDPRVAANGAANKDNPKLIEAMEKLWQDPEYRKRQGSAIGTALKGKKYKPMSEQGKASIRAALIKYYEDPAARAKMSAATKKRYEDPAEHTKQSATQKGRYCPYMIGENNPMKDPKIAKKAGIARRDKPFSAEHKAAIKEAARLPEVKAKVIAALKKNWQDPVYREKQLKLIAKGLQIKPNMPEKLLISLFEKLFPDVCKYTGDGSYPVGGKWPDFIVVGRKKIIEFFGDYTHGPKRTGRTNAEEEQQKIAHYAKYDFQTLIIWEYELQDVNTLCNRLVEFVKG